MSFEERAREILASEPASKVDAFLDALNTLRKTMGLVLPNDYIAAECPSGDIVLLQTYSEYDAGDRAKRMEKRVKKIRDELKDLAVQPQFKFHSDEFRALDVVLLAYLMQREMDRPRGRPKIGPHKEMVLWALDFCLAEELPDVGRSYREGTRSGALAHALLGRNPPSDIRSRLNQFY